MPWSFLIIRFRWTSPRQHASHNISSSQDLSPKRRSINFYLPISCSCSESTEKYGAMDDRRSCLQLSSKKSSTNKLLLNNKKVANRHINMSIIQQRKTSRFIHSQHLPFTSLPNRPWAIYASLHDGTPSGRRFLGLRDAPGRQPRSRGLLPRKIHKATKATLGDAPIHGPNWRNLVSYLKMKNENIHNKQRCIICCSLGITIESLNPTWISLPKTNIASEKWWLEDDVPFEIGCFSWVTCSLSRAG